MNGGLKMLRLIPLVALLFACSEREPAGPDVYAGVDALFERVQAAAESFEVIAEIDHSRLAAEAGEVMPPARVVLFSDPGINTRILQQQPLAGLDLPFRVLVFADGDEARVLATPAGFLAARHGLPEESVARVYDEAVARVLEGVPTESLQSFDLGAIDEGEGVVQLLSKHDFDQTIERLRTDILAEGDTMWFGEIDYQQEAIAFGVELPPLTLLLFGAPGPGAAAMGEFPRMGLDAFCQKVLVLERPDGRVEVYFNSMPAMAEMHYGRSAMPHKVINRRMGATLAGAVE